MAPFVGLPNLGYGFPVSLFMASPCFRSVLSQYRPRPEQLWSLGGVALLHIAVLALLLTYRIILPEAPEGPVIRLESVQAVPRPPSATRQVLLSITVPDLEPEVPVAQEPRSAARPPVRRPVEAMIAEEVLTPSIAANSLGARGFDLMAPPTFDAPYLQNRMPDYPPASRTAGEEGVVVLRVLVNPQGRGQAAEIYKSSGHACLDEAARQTVLRWSYVPAERGRRPVMSWTLVPFRFMAGGVVSIDDGALFQ